MYEKRFPHPTLDIVTGVGSHDLRWARCDGWRIVAYAEGGYALERWVDDDLGWCLLNDDNEMPEDIERALCAALRVEYLRD